MRRSVSVIRPTSLLWLAGALVIGFAGQASKATSGDVPAADSAVQSSPLEYRIGPLDTLSITVFEVKDLSFDKIQVDASGQLVLPLIGTVTAEGKTARELSEEIAGRLDSTYMRNPQVSVVVVDSQSEKVAVVGAVNDAGVFRLPGGRSSLLETIAMAKGSSNAADLAHVTIFRTVAGERRTLSFNGKAIEAGRQSDPIVLAGDVVVVGESAKKHFMDRIAQLAPALYLLSILHP